MTGHREVRIKRAVLSFLFLVVVMSCSYADTDSKGRSWEEIAGARQDSPGVGLRFEEVKRTKRGGFTEVTYELVAEGFPTDKAYEVWIYDLGQFLEGRGVAGPVSVPDIRKRGEFHFSKFLKGEWVEAAIISTDRTVKAFAKVVPFPIEARQGQCRMWLELMSPGRLFAVFGEGLTPGEAVTTVSRSNGEVIESKQTISQDGKLPLNIIAPAAVAHEYQASFTLTGKSCNMTIDYEWGPPSLKFQ